MIPKTIHYCWFGRGELPPLARKCIASWKKFLPDYEIKAWNEDNFDVHSNRYVAEAYNSRKFAFVTDYVRLYALYHEGGVYMDTDVEVLRSYDDFLHHPAFSGFESDGYVPTGMMAAGKGSLWAKELLEGYDDRRFIMEDGSLDLTTNTKTITDFMVSKGLKLNNKYQEIDGLCVLYPSEYFCPKSHETGQMHITENTHCIHHFAGSWLEHKTTAFRLFKIKIFLMKIFGAGTIDKIIDMLHIRQLKRRIIK